MKKIILLVTILYISCASPNSNPDKQLSRDINLTITLPPFPAGATALQFDILNDNETSRIINYANSTTDGIPISSLQQGDPVNITPLVYWQLPSNGPGGQIPPTTLPNATATYNSTNSTLTINIPNDSLLFNMQNNYLIAFRGTSLSKYHYANSTTNPTLVDNTSSVTSEKRDSNSAFNYTHFRFDIK